jgi:Skp family chaperone for outer membrane proteins
MYYSSKTAALMAFTLLVAGLGSPHHATAQQPPADAGKPSVGVLKIAVIDLERVGKQHKPYQDLVKALQSEWDTANKELQERQQKLSEQQAKLQSLRPGTPEYTQLQQEVIAEQTKFSGDLQQRQLELQEKDAALHAAMYQLIHRVVKQYADAKGIGLVVQHKSIPVATSKVQEVTLAMNQLVLYHQAPDITDVISGEVNRQALKVGP